MKKVLVLIIALGMIGLWVWRAQEKRASAIDTPPAERSESTVSAKRDDAPSSHAPARSGPPRLDSDRDSQSVLRSYKCSEQDEARCDYAVTAAISEEEAQWLLQMGYPSAEQVEQMETMPLAELKHRAEANDRIAGVFYGKRLIASGQGLQGLGAMNNALVHGSVYANYAMAEALLDKNSGVTDLTEGKARLRLAYLLGDWKASYPLAGSLDPYSSTMEIGVIDRRAMRLYEGLLSARRRANQPIVLALRPTSKDPL